MSNPVTFTLTISKDGNTTVHKFADVPYVDWWELEGALLDLRAMAHRWGLDGVLGRPPRMGDDSAGNIRVSLDADSGVANWSDAVTENGIPQAAADALEDGIDAALAPLAAYRV